MSLIKALFGAREAADISALSFDWNGRQIRFHDWADDAFGIFDYTSRDRSCHFAFDLRPVGREVRIYIVKQPGYRGRATDGHATHRLGLPDTPYICIRADLVPETVPEALSWAVWWAEGTARYIRTGQSFS